MGAACSTNKAQRAGASMGASASTMNQQAPAVPTSNNHNGRKYTPAAPGSVNPHVTNLAPTTKINLKDDLQAIEARYPDNADAAQLQKMVNEMNARLPFYPNIAPAARKEVEGIINGFQKLADRVKKEERIEELKVILDAADNTPMTDQLADQMIELLELQGYSLEDIRRMIAERRAQRSQSQGSSQGSGSAL